MTKLITFFILFFNQFVRIITTCQTETMTRNYIRHIKLNTLVGMRTLAIRIHTYYSQDCYRDAEW